MAASAYCERHETAKNQFTSPCRRAHHTGGHLLTKTTFIVSCRKWTNWTWPARRVPTCCSSAVSATTEWILVHLSTRTVLHLRYRLKQREAKHCASSFTVTPATWFQEREEKIYEIRGAVTLSAFTQRYVQVYVVLTTNTLLIPKYKPIPSHIKVTMELLRFVTYTGK